MPIDFDRPEPGEWVQPKMNGYLLSCCDCGLVHRVDFRVLKRTGKVNRYRQWPATTLGNAVVQMRFFREEEATAEQRARSVGDV